MTGPETPGAAGQAEFIVVINHEAQYAIWPANKQIPEKWTATGVSGSKDECLAHIRQVWTDMRPLSVRRRDPSGGPAGGNDTPA